MTKFEFLKSYCPKDEHITTMKEINKVCNGLDLWSALLERLQQIRNYAVETYSDLIEDELSCGHHTEQSFKYMTAMQSVTAVIDDCKLKIGAKVEEL